ncbi:DUF2306 domain-containing protein [Alicyclobacillus suci]|uniref:DUF2306 domain-containing protein n=1 Tax=Alicyclobacillus suci TaxID=2816080 RepID=UPI001A8C3ACE|nr:DUF2306 domain-containing protein [Alicyclobacillus suci]
MYRWFLGGLTALSLFWVVNALLTTFMFDPADIHILIHKQLPPHFHRHLWQEVLGLHVISSSCTMLLGLVGLLRRPLPRFRRIHRANGYIYIVAVCIAALSAGYLAPQATGGEWTSFGFNVFEAVWVITTAIAYIKIRQQQRRAHVVWMLRSYSLAYFNTGIHLWFMILHRAFSIPYDVAYTSSVWLAGPTVLLLAEWVNWRFVRRTMAPDRNFH